MEEKVVFALIDVFDEILDVLDNRVNVGRK